MGNSFACCEATLDDSAFKEYCFANASSEYQHYLSQIFYASLPQNKDVVVGQWRQDEVKTGKGVIFSPEKYYYEGDIVDSKAEGKGRIVWPSRTVFNGRMVNNQADGEGTLAFDNEEITLKGRWKDGDPALHAKLQLLSRQQRSQIFIQEIHRSSESGSHQINKFSVRIDFEGGLVYEGEVRRKNDNRYLIEGEGKLKFGDGSEYSGQFLDGKMHGKGKYLWASTGHWYEGQYKFNLRDGHGTYYSNTQTSTRGIWKSGILQDEPNTQKQ